MLEAAALHRLFASKYYSINLCRAFSACTWFPRPLKMHLRIKEQIALMLKTMHKNYKELTSKQAESITTAPTQPLAPHDFQANIKLLVKKINNGPLQPHQLCRSTAAYPIGTPRIPQTCSSQVLQRPPAQDVRGLYQE